jgi:hypothetical protein
VQSSREYTPFILSTGISNLLQPAQAEVVLGQLSTYLASWYSYIPSIDETCSTLYLVEDLQCTTLARVGVQRSEDMFC